MKKVKTSSLKNYLRKRDLFDIIDKKNNSKSRLKKGLSIFITNPTKHNDINVSKLTSFIKSSIDTNKCSLYFTSCFN